MTQRVQDRIRQVRTAFGLSRRAFAIRIGVSGTAVHNWEVNGSDIAFVPKDTSLEAIEAAFPGVSAQWLRHGGMMDLTALAAAGKPVNDRPNRSQVMEAIRELEKLPEVTAYKTLLASVSRIAA